MKKANAASGLAVGLLVLSAMVGVAQKQTQKVLEGKVLGNDDTPLVSATVYLESSKDSSVRTVFSTADGSYRFGQIAPDVDYQVWARYKDAKSGTKTVSSFDSRKVVVIDLRVKAEK